MAVPPICKIFHCYNCSICELLLRIYTGVTLFMTLESDLCHM